MKRFIDQELISWKNDSSRKPLLVRGARQIGKTYAIRELGKTYDNFVEINFESQRKLHKIFEEDLDPIRIVRDLSLSLEKQIIPGKTLLFFDEIQAVPLALTSLRYFYEEMPSLHVIAAGSLLDFTIQQVGIPVGRVMSYYMYPLSFIEFLWAINHEQLAQEIMKQDPKGRWSETIHTTCLKYLGEYLAIGGMPGAVKKWVETQNALECFKIHNTLIDTYRQDFDKYAKNFQVKYLNTLFDNIPLSVGRKFKYAAIPGEYRKRELSPALDLLVTAGIIHQVFNSAAQGIPLGAQANPEDFKVIFLDVALSQTILGLKLGEWITNPLEQFINKGEFVEAFVGQELLAYAQPSWVKQKIYYWRREARGSNAEVDYVIQQQEEIIPIEVKSGEGSTLKSMRMFLESHPKSTKGIKCSIHNFSVHENIHAYPLYAVASFMYKKS